jgi:hypothetical protein
MAVASNELVISSTVTDTNTTYDLGAAELPGTGNIAIALGGSDSTNDVVTVQAGNNITLTDNGSNVFTIDAATGGTDTNTTYDLGSAQNGNNVDVSLVGSDSTTDSIKLVAGTGVTLTDNGSNQITIDAPGDGTDTCAYGMGGTGLYTLTASYAPLVLSGSAIGVTNISGATANYVITYTLQFSPSGSTGFKSYDTKLVAQTQSSGPIDLIEFNDTVYAASDAKFTKTFTHTAVNIPDQDSIEIHIKGDITIGVEKVEFSAVATDCEAINSGKAKTLTVR